MHHGFTDWFNYQASLKILLFAMLAGAFLPGLFALGLRLQAVGSAHVPTKDGSTPQRNPVLVGIAMVIYALVLVVIIFALLYIARDFIAHHTHSPFLGAKPT
jgi:hypothetical protein